MTAATRRRPAFLAVAVALVVAGGALFVASRVSAGPPSFQDRVRSIGTDLRCPVCQDLTVADSPSRIAGQMRAEIARQLRDGRSEEQIRAFFVDRYGQWILLSPSSGGLGFLVWVAPAAALVAGLLVAASVLRRRRRDEADGVSTEDAPTSVERARIAAELAAMEEPG